MYFKDLKQGHTIYVYDRNEIEVSQYKVLNVSLPHFDTNTYSTGSKMVVDITVQSGSTLKTYTLREDSDTGYTDSQVITIDKLNIIREIEMSKTQSEEILSQVDTHTKRIKKYKELLAEFNPAIKEKQQIDERFGKLESSINEIKNILININKNDVSNN